jgi:hypothetical protein
MVMQRVSGIFPWRALKRGGILRVRFREAFKLARYLQGPFESRGGFTLYSLIGRRGYG